MSKKESGFVIWLVSGCRHLEVGRAKTVEEACLLAIEKHKENYGRVQVKVDGKEEKGEFVSILF